MNLYKAGRDFFIDGVLVTLYDLAAERNGALLVDIFKKLVVVNDNLQNSVLVADVKEHNAAVVTDILYPAGYLNLLADVFFS